RLRMSGQPLPHVGAHLGHDLVRRMIALRRHAASAGSQLFRVIGNARGWIELVFSSSEVKHVELGLAIDRTRLPITGKTAANPDDTAQTLRVRKREAIVESARLREAQQKH